VVIRAWLLNLTEEFDNCLNRFFNAPLLAGQRAECRHPYLFVRDDKWNHSCFVFEWILPLNFVWFGAARFLHLIKLIRFKNSSERADYI
jgi:hypothetical protein